MENKPVRRSPYIVKLSRDHHAGLLFCWKIRQGKNLSIDLERIKKYVAYFLGEHLTAHFEEEENYLFAPQMQDELVQRAMADHKSIDRLSAEIKSASGPQLSALLDEIADAVDAHIRFEERTLFPHMEQVLSKIQLRKVSSQLGHESEKDTYADEFWIKPKS